MATLPAWNWGSGPPQNLAACETGLLVSPKVAYPFKCHMIHCDKQTESWIFGALVHDEVGFDYHLRKLPLQFAGEFRAMASKGRAALEQGDWQTAEMSFLGCKDMLLRSGTTEQFVKHPLMGWVNLFLAQSYQAMGSRVDTLLKVLVLWRDTVLGVYPLLDTEDPRLQAVCSAFAYKAQYELGEASGNSSMKKEAIQGFREIWRHYLSFSDDAAESGICFLLCCDYDRLGRFNDSLRWIRKATMKDSAGWNSCKSFFLEYEARLLMRLQRFSEAAEALNKLCTFRPTRAVHELLHECYTQTSRRAADVQHAKQYEELAIEQLKLMQ